MKIDVFNHIFPQAYFDKVMEVAMIKQSFYNKFEQYGDRHQYLQQIRTPIAFKYGKAGRSTYERSIN